MKNPIKAESLQDLADKLNEMTIKFLEEYGDDAQSPCLEDIVDVSSLPTWGADLPEEHWDYPLWSWDAENIMVTRDAVHICANSESHIYQEFYLESRDVLKGEVK